MCPDRSPAQCAKLGRQSPVKSNAIMPPVVCPIRECSPAATRLYVMSTATTRETLRPPACDPRGSSSTSGRYLQSNFPSMRTVKQEQPSSEHGCTSTNPAWIWQKALGPERKVLERKSYFIPIPPRQSCLPGWLPRIKLGYQAIIRALGR